MLGTIAAILLTILKIIGIILAVIVGLAILLVLAILFVPIRYSIRADGRAPDFRGKAVVSWLLHIVSVSFAVDNGTALYIRIFGIPIKKTVSKSERKEDDGRDLTAKILDKIFPEKKEADPKAQQKAAPVAQPQETLTIIAEADKAPDDNKEEPEKDSVRILEEIVRETREAESAESFVKEKKSIKQKIKDFFAGIKEKIKSIVSKLSELYKKGEEKYEEVTGFFEDRENIEAINLIKKKLLLLLKHYKPRKIKGRLVLGLSDPSLTGKIIGAYYMFFEPRRSFLDLKGEFKSEVIEGDIFIKGRVRLNHLAAAAIVLYRNKKIKSWIKKED